MCKVYTGYFGTSEREHGLCACTVDNPLAKAQGLSLRTGAQTISISHLYHWNQSTIISLDLLNTVRIYFRTSSSLVHWSVKKASLTEYPACYNNLERVVHMLLENV